MTEGEARQPRELLNDVSRDTAQRRVYRMPRYLLLFSATTLPIWTALAAIGIWLPYANPDGSFADPTIPAMLSGGTFGLCALGSAILLFASIRTRLTLSNDELSISELFSSQVIRVSDISRCQWRGNVGHAIVKIEAAGRKHTQRLSNFANTSALIEHIHAVVPKSAQEGYEGFVARSFQPRPRPKYGDKVMIRLALAAFAVAIATAVFRGWTFQPLVVLQLSMPILAIAIIALIDFVRKPSRIAGIAAILACVAATIVAAMSWSHFTR